MLLQPCRQSWMKANAASHLWAIAQQHSRVLDSSLLLCFAHLPRPQQADLAKHAGLAPDHILRLLRDMAASTNLF
jgi:DNA-binding IclR family transcriptional regulator